MPADEAARLRVSVAFSPRAGCVDETELLLAPDATVADALRQSGIEARHPHLAVSALAVGVWGVPRQRGDRLRDGDRVELWRPLLADPKTARRRREQAQRLAQQIGKRSR